MATEPSRLEANRLYWETDASVGHIADALGVSRRALYELLEPLSADQTCPACGSPLLFANRLARAAGDALCGSCGASQRLAPVAREGAAAAGDVSAPSASFAPPPRAAGPAARPRAPRVDAGNGSEAGALDAAANDTGDDGAPPPMDRVRPPRRRRAAREDGAAARSDSTLERAAHAFGLPGEQEAAQALARVVRVFGFALAGVLAGMAVVSILRRRR